MSPAHALRIYNQKSSCLRRWMSPASGSDASRREHRPLCPRCRVMGSCCLRSSACVVIDVGAHGSALTSTWSPLHGSASRPAQPLKIVPATRLPPSHATLISPESSVARVLLFLKNGCRTNSSFLRNCGDCLCIGVFLIPEISCVKPPAVGWGSLAEDAGDCRTALSRNTGAQPR